MSQPPLQQEQVQTSTEIAPAIQTPQSGNITINGRILVSIGTAALFISFFLPWVTFLGAQLSGLDIQKNFSSYKLVWALPLFALITFGANVCNQDTNLARRIAGLVPFGILAYAMNQLGNDLWQIIAPGGWLALGSGALLICIPNHRNKA